MIKVTILGNNSALPAHGRHPTAQVVEMQDELFLVDCGEGTQVRLQELHISRSRIDHIFISHLHGDHYFGLIGLINSMGLLGRIAPLHLYGPAPLLEIIQLQMKAADGHLPFELRFTDLTAMEPGLLVNHKRYKVSFFPVEHRIPAFGFLFEEVKAKRQLNPERCKEYMIPKYFYGKLTEGEDYIRRDETVVKNEWVTLEGKKGKRYAFCADTKYTHSFLPWIEGIDAIYHETTFLKDLTERAADRYHSTTAQAGQLALDAGVATLLIGHYSSKYKDLTPFFEETKAVFPNTILTVEGETYLI